MRPRIVLVALLALSSVAVSATAVGFPVTTVLARYAIAKGGDVRWELPNALAEISGLTTMPNGRLFAHGDERAVIYELDAKSGQVVKSFTMGRRGVRGDFEGIAVTQGRFWLVTSDGILYESREGAKDSSVAFVTHDTGVGSLCEVEGLTYDPPNGALLIACKTPRGRALQGTVAVFSWSIARRALLNRSGVRVRAADVARSAGVSSFHPSGIERDATTGNWLLIAGPERAIVEITPAGQVVGGAALVRRAHRQPEGITLTTERTLLIADEGAGRRGTLTAYRRAR